MVLGKVLNFMWRVCKGRLPTAATLVSKRVNISGQCAWCHSADESTEHVLFECEFAKTVWENTGLQKIVQGTNVLWWL